MGQYEPDSLHGNVQTISQKILDEKIKKRLDTFDNRIEELENVIQKIGVKVDFTSDEVSGVNQEIALLKAELTKLIYKVEYLDDEAEYINYDYMRKKLSGEKEEVICQLDESNVYNFGGANPPTSNSKPEESGKEKFIRAWKREFNRKHRDPFEVIVPENFWESILNDDSKPEEPDISIITKNPMEEMREELIREFIEKLNKLPYSIRPIYLIQEYEARLDKKPKSLKELYEIVNPKDLLTVLDFSGINDNIDKEHSKLKREFARKVWESIDKYGEKSPIYYKYALTDEHYETVVKCVQDFYYWSRKFNHKYTHIYKRIVNALEIPMEDIEIIIKKREMIING